MNTDKQNVDMLGTDPFPDYDGYGNMLASSGVGSVSNNPYRYTGQQWDPDLGMYYLRARYYNPKLGRFWTGDTYEGEIEDPLSLHKYLYCEANPVNGTDPTGHDDIADIGSLDSFVMPTYSKALRSSLNVLGTLPGVAFPGGVRIIIDLDSGAPNNFDRTEVQQKLRVQMAKEVFNNISGPNTVQLSVITGLAGPQLGWSGNPKSQYIHQVMWEHGTLMLHAFAYTKNSKTSIDVTHIETEFATRKGGYGSQLWVNILAHEVFWHGTGDHADTGQEGDISGVIGNANTSFSVSESSRATIIEDLGFKP